MDGVDFRMVAKCHFIGPECRPLCLASIEDGREFDGICLLNTPIQLDELWRGKGPAMRWKGRWIRRCCPCQIPYNFCPERFAVTDILGIYKDHQLLARYIHIFIPIVGF